MAPGKCSPRSPCKYFTSPSLLFFEQSPASHPLHCSSHIKPPAPPTPPHNCNNTTYLPSLHLMLGNSCQLAEKLTHSSSEVKYSPWIRAMSLFSPPQVRIAMSTYALLHISIYCLCKAEIADVCFVNFCHALLSCSLFAQIDPLRTLYSRHSRYLGSLVAIQQRTHEKIANNRF